VTTQQRRRKPVPLEVVIGRAIRHLRRRRGLTQHMLAKRLGIRVERVREYESAKRAMTPRMLIRLATVLEVSLSAFFRSYRRARPLGTMAPGPTAYSRDAPLPPELLLPER
jgi:transcriptional regulator with XRE-family HTH domain